MRISSLLRAGMLALAVAGIAASVAPAFASAIGNARQTQAQNSNTGPYDGPAFEAAKNAPNG